MLDENIPTNIPFSSHPVISRLFISLLSIASFFTFPLRLICICWLWWTLIGHCSPLHNTHTLPSIILLRSTVNHSTLLDSALRMSVSPPTAFTILFSLPPPAFHSHASDPSRCFNPCYTLSFIGLHLLHTPLSSARSQTAVRLRTS